MVAATTKNHSVLFSDEISTKCIYKWNWHSFPI